jgi:ribosomal protein S28E/S33
LDTKIEVYPNPWSGERVFIADGVAAGSTIDHVCPGSADNDVVSGTSEDHVVTRAAVNLVVGAVARDVVAPVRADDILNVDERRRGCDLEDRSGWRGDAAGLRCIS